MGASISQRRRRVVAPYNNYVGPASGIYYDVSTLTMLQRITGISNSSVNVKLEIISKNNTVILKAAILLVHNCIIQNERDDIIFKLYIDNFQYILLNKSNIIMCIKV